MKRNICIVTGDNEKLIQKEIHNKIITCNKSNLIYYKLLFPEDRKHPKKYCKYVKDIIFDNDDCNILIATFSEQIINMIGSLINTNQLHKDEVMLRLVLEDNTIIKSYYDSDGILYNFPIDFFNWWED